MAAVPITVHKVLGHGAQAPEIRRIAEHATQTFQAGTPVQIDADGFLIESPAQSSAILCAGISLEPGHSLTSDGVPKHLTYGAVQNQASAVLIPVGAPPSDGKCGFVVAGPSIIFKGKLRAAGSVAQTLLNQLAGLVEDTNHFWYVDETVTNPASGALVEIVELIDPIGTAAGYVGFKFTQAAQQLYQ